MPDDMDRAQAREEEMRADALAEHQRRAHGDGTVPSAIECALCDEPIPEGRRRAIPGCSCAPNARRFAIATARRGASDDPL